MKRNGETKNVSDLLLLINCKHSIWVVYKVVDQSFVFLYVFRFRKRGRGGVPFSFRATSGCTDVIFKVSG